MVILLHTVYCSLFNFHWYGIDWFQESHSVSLVMVVFGRQEAAERPGLGNDGHWAGLFGPGGSCVAVGPGRLAGHNNNWF